MTDNPLQARADHETGHVVLGLALGYRVVSVDVHQHGLERGGLTHGDGNPSDCEHALISRGGVFAEILVDAEWDSAHVLDLIQDVEDELGPEHSVLTDWDIVSDYDDASKYDELCSEHTAVEHDRRTVALLMKYRAEHERISRELFRRNELDEATILRLWNNQRV